MKYKVGKFNIDENHGDDFSKLSLWLRDGIDVYVSDNDVVNFVFLSTRKRLTLKVPPLLIETLEWFTGKYSVSELQTSFNKINKIQIGKETDQVSFKCFAFYLYSLGILVPKNWMEDSLSAKYVSKFSRQLNFLLDIEETTNNTVNLFNRIIGTKIALFGVGAIGSWILTELVQLGFRRFVIIDPKLLSKSDVARNALFNHRLIGTPKVDIAKEYLISNTIDPEIRIEQKALDFDTDIFSLIGRDVDLIINTADEPYIGATSIKLSRFCVSQMKPLLVSGGFDAHLGSLSEIIVPGVTPCSDCYANHFKMALKGWKPVRHPIQHQQKGMGGLPSMAVFSASTAVLKIVRLLSTKVGELDEGRGEFLFDDYQIEAFKVERNIDCPVCGNKENIKNLND